MICWFGLVRTDRFLQYPPLFIFYLCSRRGGHLLTISGSFYIILSRFDPKNFKLRRYQRFIQIDDPREFQEKHKKVTIKHTEGLYSPFWAERQESRDLSV